MELHAEAETGAKKAKSKAKGDFDISEFQKLKFFTEFLPAIKKVDANAKKTKASGKKLSDDLKVTNAEITKANAKTAAAKAEAVKAMKKESDDQKKNYLMMLVARINATESRLIYYKYKVDQASAACKEVAAAP